MGEAMESHVGVTQQHQCLIVHKAISCASLNVQVAIHKIPICDPLQFVLSWVMEKEGSKTRIRIGCQLESKIPFLSGTVGMEGTLDPRSPRLFRRRRSECATCGFRQFRKRSRMKSSFPSLPCRQRVNEDSSACGCLCLLSSFPFSFCSIHVFVNKETISHGDRMDTKSVLDMNNLLWNRPAVFSVLSADVATKRTHAF